MSKSFNISLYFICMSEGKNKEVEERQRKGSNRGLEIGRRKERNNEEEKKANR